jgi:nicotinamidase-related amidase
MTPIFSSPVLLIIDSQKGIDEAEFWGGQRNNPDAENNIKALLDTWRQKKLPVIHVQHCSVNPESPFWPGKEGHQLKELTKPIDGEILIQKTGVPNAFIGTLLQPLLTQQGLHTLFITGFITNNSVEATARMAGNLGFQTSVVADATATFNKAGLYGEVYEAELVHALSLANLKDEYAAIVTTAEVLKGLA